MVSFVLDYNSEGPDLTGGLSKEPSHIPSISRATGTISSSPLPARRRRIYGWKLYGRQSTLQPRATQLNYPRVCWTRIRKESPLPPRSRFMTPRQKGCLPFSRRRNISKIYWHLALGSQKPYRNQRRFLTTVIRFGRTPAPILNQSVDVDPVILSEQSSAPSCSIPGPVSSGRQCYNAIIPTKVSPTSSRTRVGTLGTLQSCRIRSRSSCPDRSRDLRAVWPRQGRRGGRIIGYSIGGVTADPPPLFRHVLQIRRPRRRREPN